MATSSIEQVQLQYRIFNSAYFGDALPPSEISFVKDLRVHGKASLGATTKELGADGKFFIQLEASLAPALQKLTLMHEMVHVKLWPRSHKSKAWKAEVARLGSLGFLSEIF